MVRPRLLANDILRLFVSSQPQEDRLAELVIQFPLGKFDLAISQAGPVIIDHLDLAGQTIRREPHFP